MIDLTREGDVFILTMNAGENRFGDQFMKDWNEALDEVENADGPKALVTTGTGKFYSNGLDLEWATAQVDFVFDDYISDVIAIYGRVLTFPCATVAAVNGHAFGAGGQLMMAHDFRVMREDRGYFCMPEIDMRAPLHPGMTAILQARLPKQTAHEVIATGRRYGGADALAAGIVEHIAPEARVLPRAIEIAAPLAAKAHPVMSTLKAGLYPQVLEALTRKLDGATIPGETH